MADPRKRKGRGALALLSSLWMGVLLVGQLQPLAHFLLVQHVQCPEHGELIEVSRESSTTFHPPATPSDVPTLSARADETSAHHGHDHCTTGLCSIGDSIIRLGDGSFASVHSNVVRCSAADSGATGLRERFRVAPKQSPPASV